MNRREALKKVAFLVGGTVIGSRAFLEYETGVASPSEPLPEADIALLDEIAETMIPATDTPGAKAAEVGKFMEIMIHDCYTEANRSSFYKGLKKIRKNFKAEYGHSFIDANLDDRIRFLKHLHQENQNYRQHKDNNDPAHYFQIMRELTLLGYFTSEIGCTQAHRYIQTPGRYEAEVEYTKGEKSWIAP